MSDDDHRDFEDVLRGIAQEVTDTLERLSEVDVDAIARSTGIDPERGRQWFDQASRWLQDKASQATSAAPADVPGDEAFSEPDRAARTPDTTSADTTWAQAEPHPLDVPTAAQGAALAALDSGRWTLEPGTSALTAVGDGPGPSDALGLVRALRVRDWLRADGSVTVAGQHALERWLATTD